MYAEISPQKIHLPPGTVVRMEGRTWQDYQTLLAQVGDRVLPRIKYRPGEILLMAPMPRHGFDASLIADIAKVLLEHVGHDFLAYTPITMDLPEVRGIEPDYSFYIDHYRSVIGKDRINWATEPPPDLVLEIDVTSYTDVNDYLAYRIPEVWLWKGGALQIHSLQDNHYTVVSHSQFFPNIALPDIIVSTLETARQTPSNRLLQNLRQQFPPKLL